MSEAPKSVLRDEIAFYFQVNSDSIHLRHPLTRLTARIDLQSLSASQVPGSNRSLLLDESRP
jgi:hypothetical protein